MSSGRTLKIERTTSTAHRLHHYDGVCGNIHGHNFKWEVKVMVRMGNTGDDNMVIDLKDISNEIDKVDHACLLNADDPLAQSDNVGRLVLFDSDPTCEKVSKWMADKILDLHEDIRMVKINLYETEKYGVQADTSVIERKSGE